ncbi:hypothetical protein [Desulfovibrio inopinatus]|uniref:hypothetical protein n=1 Tax=Desulfovibrio inopinatus TaxID=102109 RepID=UPI0012EC5374|nr:hypothetical protein [Desulfovibrio inopinatus]
MIFDQLRNIGLCTLAYVLILWYMGSQEIIAGDVLRISVVIYIVAIVLIFAFNVYRGYAKASAEKKKTQ